MCVCVDCLAQQLSLQSIVHLNVIKFISGNIWNDETHYVALNLSVCSDLRKIDVRRTKSFYISNGISKQLRYSSREI